MYIISTNVKYIYIIVYSFGICHPSPVLAGKTDIYPDGIGQNNIKVKNNMEDNMDNNDKNLGTFENSIPRFEANMKKNRLVSGIIEKSEQGDEEVNKGRS